MRISSQKVNAKGVVVSKSKMQRFTQKYVSLYCQSSERLYYQGYLSTPLDFCEDEFWDSFFEVNSHLLPLFRNNQTGAMNLTARQTRYVLRGISDDEEKVSLEAVADLLTAKAKLEAYNKFLELTSFRKKSDTLQCKSKLYVSGTVKNASKLPLDEIMECFDVPSGKKVVACDYSVVILKVLLERLGMSTDVKPEDASLFLGDGYTVQDDCAYLDMLIRGEVWGSGENAEQLHKTIETYYNEFYEEDDTISVCQPYEENLFISAIPKCIEFVNDYRHSLGEYEEYYTTDSMVYFLVDGEDEVGTEVTHSVYIGTQVANLNTGEALSVVDRLLGYSGEFLHEFDVTPYKAGGMPVELVEGNYFPTVCLTYEDDIVYSRPLEYKFKTVEEMCETLFIDSLDTLDTEAADLIEGTEEVKVLAGRLVQALFCTMCNYTLPNHESPNQVLTDGVGVTDDLYIDACFAAEKLYRNLGF